MNQPQRVEGEAELKCGADKFFDVWAQKPYLVTKMCPNKYPKIELHQGDWNKVGAYMTWTYVCSKFYYLPFLILAACNISLLTSNKAY